jgi:hypothetical protein
VSDAVEITSNASYVAEQFVLAGVRTAAKGKALLYHYGVRLLASVKAHASGRPGPRMVTGDYNRRIALQFSGGENPRASVITNADQGLRLEFGFMGMTDSLGRTFHQPPYPHFGPGFDEIAPQFERAVRDLPFDVFED